MNKPVCLSVALLLGAIAFYPQSAKGLCLNDDTLITFDRDIPPEDESFVSSSPASGDTEFKVLFDLDNLGSFASGPESESTPRETMTAADAESTETADSTTADSEEATSVDTLLTLEEATTEDGEPLYVSREDFLDAMAEDLNSCQ